MRLLQWNNDNNKFVFSYHDNNPPPYAIFSHTWSENNDEEVDYKDLLTGTTKSLSKLILCRDWAFAAGYSYFWIDTCCINKRDDAELAYAIRSMYHWYERAAVCFVYLSDLSKSKRKAPDSDTADWRQSLKNCRWFTRGWTLQELIAPQRVEFYARDGYLGSKKDLLPLLTDITGVDLGAKLPEHHVRLRWIANRKTKRPEDKAYCMMGICNVVMSAQYGEGEHESRRRLEVAIVQRHGLPMAERGIHASIDEDHRKTMLDLLRFEAMESRRTTISVATKQTCEWILDQPVCVRWLQSEHSFFWIKGKPGAGKSVMVKFLDEYITRTRHDALRLSFYFTARGEQLEKTFAGMYRSLLVQLLDAAPELHHMLDNMEHNRALDNIHLQRILAEGIRKLEKRIYFFIDAVDECQDRDVQEMIDFFENLQGGSAAVSVCFASRHYPVHDIPTRLQLTLEDAVEHNDDLGEYVRTNLRLDKATQRQREEISTGIVSKAEGVFLWVVLVVKILQQEISTGRLHAVKARLTEIPQGLKELFEDILRRDQDNIGEFILCLRWILYAKRPLKLPEFYFAMMAGLTTQDLKWVPDNITQDQMHAFLLTSSKGFAELTKAKKPTAQFIHESVRDYLIKDNGFYGICGETGELLRSSAHDQLKLCCSRGLTFAISEDATADGELEKLLSETHHHTLTASYPFAEYATLYILYHADEAAVGHSQQLFLTSDFNLLWWTERFNAVQKHRTKVYSIPPSFAYVCAERNLARLLVRPCDALLVEKQRYATPLFAAFLCSSWEVARILLNDMDASETSEIISEAMSLHIKPQKAYSSAPWIWAMRNRLGHLALHLLRSTSGPDMTRLVNGQNAFHLAIEQGNLALMNHMLTLHPPIVYVESTSPAMTATPLALAACLGRTEAIVLLLAAGVDVDMKGSSTCKTALCVASAEGQEEAVKMLIAAGADVHGYRTSPRSDAYLAALAKGHEKVVEMLLAAGVDANAEFAWPYDNALYSASESGLEKMVEVLLRAGADVNAHCRGKYDNALVAASAEGHEKVVEVLLAAGADVNAKTKDHETALHWASGDGRYKVVEVLLAAGADVNADSAWPYGNALIAASANGHEKVVEVLLAAGADVNAKTKDHKTALYDACRHGYYKVVEVLLAAGADVHDPEWEKWLLKLDYEFQEKAVELLLAARAKSSLGDVSTAAIQN